MQSTSVNDRAFFRAIAGNDTSRLTSAQIRQAADGLAGHPADGTIDAVERAAFNAAATLACVTAETSSGLDTALRGGSWWAPIDPAPAGTLRFPKFFDTSHLHVSGAAPKWVLLDDDANRMELSLEPGYTTLLVATFARAGEPTRKDAPIQLTSAEAHTLAVGLAGLALEKAHATPKHFALSESLDAHMTSTQTLPAAADAQDLSKLMPTAGMSLDPRYAAQSRTYQSVLPDGTGVKLSWPGDQNIDVSYRKPGGAWSAPRLVTESERRGLQTWRELSDVTPNLNQQGADISMLLAIIAVGTMERP